MPVTRDIVATYRGPRAVVRRLLAVGRREDRALAILMGGCLVAYVSQWPVYARQAHLDPELTLNDQMAGGLYACILVLPLLAYLIAALSHGVARLFGGQGSFYGARVALFWAFLAATPLMLLNGLVGGFVGPGPALTLVGLLWSGVFLWFWGSGLWVAEHDGTAEAPA